MSDFNTIEMFFLACAIIGAIFVLFRLVMQFIGLDHDVNLDFDAHGADIDLHHAESDVGFKILSLHSLASFLMMFGLVGLALYRQSQTGTLIALIGGILAGAASVWVIGRLFSMFTKFQSSGTISTKDALGAVGTVYLTIPENGIGRVLVKIKNSLREYDASSNNQIRLPTDTPIRVVWVEGNVLVVEEI